MRTSATVMQPASRIKTQGLHHLGLTVPDHVEVADFFCRILQFHVVGGVPDYPATFISDGHIMLTLWQAPSTANVRDFDRHHNVGLHHFALAVSDGTILRAIYNRLNNETGVTIEFPPERLGTTELEHMICFVPGGLRVEFITAE